MLDLIKGNSNDLEGKAVIFSTKENDQAFPCPVNGTLFYPSLVIRIKSEKKAEKTDYYLNMGEPISFLKDEIDDVYDSEGDLVKIVSGALSREIVIDELRCAANWYFDKFVEQDKKREFLTRKYGAKFDNPKRLNQLEFKQIVIATTLNLVSGLLNQRAQDYSEALVDLQYLTQEAPFKVTVWKLAEAIFNYNGTPTKTLEELAMLCVSKIQSIVEERFEIIPEIDKKIKALLDS